MSSERILVEFSDSAPDNAVQYFKECLIADGFVVKEEKCMEHKVIGVECPSFMKLLKAAEEHKFTKQKADGQVTQVSAEDIETYSIHDLNEPFFTPAEKIFLLEYLLDKVPFDKKKFLKTGLKKFGNSESMLRGCIHSKPVIVELYTPMHNKAEQRALWNNMKNNPLTFPYHEIRDYFGEEIAFYIAWMSFFSTSLVPIAIFGVALFFHRPKGMTVDDSPYLPFYALLMAFWCIYFVKCWRRRESELALRWNTIHVEKETVIRPEFYGEMRPSPITGMMEKYYPAWKRRCQYFVSFLLATPFLLLGVCAMILSLNLNGYIHHPESPIRFAMLAKFAKPGGIFAADNQYYGWMVPTIGHSLIIGNLNKLYRSVASFATDLENHRTDSQYQTSLTVKRTIFELFDCYLPLFYIAFYQLEIISLRRELVGLFWGDEIRRVATETIIPALIEKFKSVSTKKKLEKAKKTDEEIECNLEVLENITLEEYEQFDDYIEMVVQFGYVTLFASAFPLCSVITIGFLFLEVRSDLFRLLFLYRRPSVGRVKDIGVWFQVLMVMMLMSMVTNCFLFGFASEQLASWVPEFYETHADGDQFIKLGYGRYVVAIVFSAEHVLLLCVALCHFFISDKPVQVKRELEKREYLKTQAAKRICEEFKKSN